MQQKILNNRYELEQRIGEGGMARVYRGRDLRLNRTVAVKVLHGHYASDPAFLQRFHHEAQAAANLRHPNIVEVYDVGQDGDVHYIVMEYIEGSDLKPLIMRSGPLPIERALGIAEAVARALDVAHRMGMVHRDIKPQNIIVGPEGQVKITDFGIAKSALSTALTETGVTFGTADYISPEQARGLVATPRSDVYALGVTLYEMLTGRLPFSGDSAVAIAMQHVSSDPPPPRMFNPHIPPRLEGLVLRALSKDPQQRPATGQEFAQLLSSYRQVGGQETMVRPVVPYVMPQHAPQVAARSGTQPVQQVHRPPLPPSRPQVVAHAPPRSSGLGFGGFLLGLLLLTGVLGLVYLFSIGTFDDLIHLTIDSPRPSVTVGPVPATVGPTVLPLVQVPDVVGLDEQAAIAALEQAHFRPQFGVARNSDDVGVGLVLEQMPSAGEAIAETGVVTYVLSLGPAMVDVPDVVRQRASDAQATLEQAGFQVVLEQGSGPDDSEGFVLRQRPFAHARLRRGEVVTIVVSIGDKVIMPDVTGQTEAEARIRIAAAGLTWVYSDLQSCEKLGELCDRFGPGVVVSSIPRGGEQVARGAEVTLGVREP